MRTFIVTHRSRGERWSGVDSGRGSWYDSSQPRSDAPAGSLAVLSYPAEDLDTAMEQDP
jgi:hypothetical protein